MKKKRTTKEKCQRGHVATQRVQHIRPHLFHVKEESVTSLLKAPISPEGWNELSELTGSQQGRQGEAGLCATNIWTPNPLFGLGPAAAHQTPRPLACDDAIC